jgi:hypothetical protein
MLNVCPELLEYILMPPSDMEPASCEINILRNMSDDDRQSKLNSMSFSEQLKLARNHKVCTTILNKCKCLLSE